MLTAVVWLCALPPSLALLYFSAEVMFGIRPLQNVQAAEPKVSVTVIIPAHNEALLIGATVDALRRCVEPETQILVVADNCSDQTAQIARAAGATAIERNDPSRRGKGFALAFARDFLASAAPEAVFVLDADCRVEEGSVEAIAGHAVALDEPVQSINLQTAPSAASPMVQVSNFAMLIKNLVRARGLYRLGGGMTLFGTGMAFPWRTFAQAQLATSEAVEDLHLAVLLAEQGTKIHFCEGLRVTSAAADLEDSLAQRRRWEHGFLSNALRHGVPLLLRGLWRRSRHLLYLGAHLLVPPLALLFLVASAALVPAILLAAWSGAAGPALFLAGALALAVIVVGIAWYREGREILGLRTVVRAPLYVLWKIPLYLGFVSLRQTEWNRTRRPSEKS